MRTIAEPEAGYRARLPQRGHRARSRKMGAFESCRSRSTRTLCQRGEVIKRLRDAAATSYHEFWPDDLSILDQTFVNNAHIHGPKKVTDVYLLALAVQHAGRFVTFDGAVPLSAVLRAEKEHLAVI